MTLQKIYEKLHRSITDDTLRGELTDFYNDVNQGWGALRGQIAEREKLLAAKDAVIADFRLILIEKDAEKEKLQRQIEILPAGIVSRDQQIHELTTGRDNWIEVAATHEAQIKRQTERITELRNTIASTLGDLQLAANQSLLDQNQELLAQLESARDSIRKDGTTCDKCGGQFTGNECDCALAEADDNIQPDAPEADPHPLYQSAIRNPHHDSRSEQQLSGLQSVAGLGSPSAL
jgi:chromosome segregation ATPase